MTLALRIAVLAGMWACVTVACAASTQPSDSSSTPAPTASPFSVTAVQTRAVIGNLTPTPTRPPLATLSPASTAATALATPAPTRSAPPLVGSGNGAGSTVITTTNAQNLKLIREFSVRPGMVNLALSPDGRTVAIGHDDGNVSLLHLPSPLSGDAKPADLLSGHQREVSDLAFSPDGALFASISLDDDGTLIRDGQTGQSLYKIGGGVSLAFSPDAKQLAVGDQDGNITLWTVTRSKADKVDTLRSDKDEPVCSVGYASGGARLVAGSCDYTLGVWNVASRRLEFSLPNVRAFVCATLHCDYLVSNKLALNATGSLVASVIPDEKVGVWDTTTGNQVHVFAGEGEHLQADGAAFTPDSKLLALSRWNTIFLYDVATWKLVGQVSAPRTPESAITQLRFSADGKLLVSGSNGKVQVWGVPKE